MKLLPLMYLDILDDTAIRQHSCSDRIWLPRTSFEHWIHPTEAGTVTLLELQNRLGQSIIGCVFGVHHGDNETIYVPKWMYDTLDFDTEHIELTRATPSLCTGLILQPHTSDHIRATEPQEFLRDGFEQYSVLYPGQHIDLWVGDDRVVTCTIIQLQPMNDQTLAIRNCELVLDLLPPLDLPIPPPPSTMLGEQPIVNKIVNAASTFVNEVVAAIKDEDVTAVTEPEPEATRRQKMAAAARKRLGVL
jgi:hypothetical protein